MTCIRPSGGHGMTQTTEVLTNRHRNTRRESTEAHYSQRGDSKVRKFMTIKSFD